MIKLNFFFAITLINFFIYIQKCLKLYQLNFIKKIKKDYKKNLVKDIKKRKRRKKEEKEKNQQYSHGHYKNPSEDEK